MSTLSVTVIKTGDEETPLSFTTGNTNSGSIKVEAANNDVVFFGNARITGGLTANGVDVLNLSAGIGLAYTQANVAYTQANVAYTQANVAYTQANNAYSTANNAASTGKAIAMAIVFG
jgi:hypothetical protein